MSIDLEKYLLTWRKRLEEEAAFLEQRRRMAQEAAARMAQILVEELAAERVYLIGSLLRPEDFSAHSDIDLVATGLDPALYFKALARIWKELPKGMEVDLIPFEDANDYLRTLTIAEGLLLYDQSRTADSQKRD